MKSIDEENKEKAKARRQEERLYQTIKRGQRRN